MNLPEKYGRYQIKQIIGQGGMSTVYLAHDPRFGRDVALKVISSNFKDDPTFRSRFEREARTIAHLEHTAIVPVYDFGEDHDKLYLVMRHMSNGSLSDRIMMGPLSGAQAMPIIRRLAGALDHAHQKGVVHRDLKPSNILFDEYERAYLSDFGIVKLAAEGTDTNLTGSGVIGTPSYMSPEQIHGDELIDGRADIYTLGVILFEMLTGRKPYRADTPVKQMMAHVMDPIPDIRKILPDFPAKGIPVIEKALAKDVSSRYQTAQELTAALTATLTMAPLKLAHPAQEPLEANSDAETITQDADTVSNLPILPRNQAEAGVAKTNLAAKSTSKKWRWLAVVAVVLALLTSLGIFLLQRVPVAQIAATLPAVTLPAVVAATMALTEATAVSNLQPPTEEPTVAPTVSHIEAGTFTLGQSFNGSDIEGVRLGSGPRKIILLGGLHAGIAPATVTLLEELEAHFEANSEAVPADISLFMVPNANPDSGELKGRFNGNGVDLNRNWACQWQPAIELNRFLIPAGGGQRPFSEPETTALRDFVLAQAPELVVIFDAPVKPGLISIGSCGGQSGLAHALANSYSAASRYQVGDVTAVFGHALTGDAANWIASQGIAALTIWLSDAEEADFEQNLAGVTAVVQQLSDE